MIEMNRLTVPASRLSEGYPALEEAYFASPASISGMELPNSSEVKCDLYEHLKNYKQENAIAQKIRVRKATTDLMIQATFFGASGMASILSSAIYKETEGEVYFPAVFNMMGTIVSFCDVVSAAVQLGLVKNDQSGLPMAQDTLANGFIALAGMLKFSDTTVIKSSRIASAVIRNSLQVTMLLVNIIKPFAVPESLRLISLILTSVRFVSEGMANTLNSFAQNFDIQANKHLKRGSVAMNETQQAEIIQLRQGICLAINALCNVRNGDEQASQRALDEVGRILTDTIHKDTINQTVNDTVINMEAGSFSGVFPDNTLIA